MRNYGGFLMNKVKGRDFVLGFQHLFAMFGATVLVPAITGLSVSATLLFAGLGTLLFHLITGRRVPAFLGSSFAFLGGYSAIMESCARAGIENFIPYAGIGVACSGILYFILAFLFKVFGADKVMRYFPPIVTGPIIIAIGLTLSGGAIANCSANWLVAIIAILIVIVCNIWGRGMIRIIPILAGVIGSYVIAAVLAAVCGQVISPDGGAEVVALFGNPSLTVFECSKLETLKNAAWIGLPLRFGDTAFSLIGSADISMVITSIITIMPIAIATMIEHIGDISAISSTVGKNFIEKPGLHRTLLGDGLATALAALFGAPANTTYGENTGVLALTKVYDPRVIRIAAVFAMLLSFSPKFAALVTLMPEATMGGISLILYGMISAVGVRNIVENRIDLSKSRNIIIAALILVLAIGIKFGTEAQAVSFTVGQITISLSGLAVAAVVGIFFNAVLPGNDFDFKKSAVNKK